MRCAKCRAENRTGVKFCEECGAGMEIACPSCGARIPVEKKFCGECGRDLGKPKEVPPIDYDRPLSYTPKFLSEKILTKRSSIEGERKLVTVLFADVADYTTMSEKLDPEEVHQIMDGFFRILMDEIHRYEGTINQFTGDGVMALFGAPVAHEDHAQRACHAALAIQKALTPYEETLRSGSGISFKLRIGINSGPVIVGAIGDDLRMDYTAVGDTTNVASRMQGLARPGSVLVSQSAYRIARDFFTFEPMGEVEVKGKKRPLETFELIQPGVVETRIEASAAKGLTRFVGRSNSMAALMAAYERAGSGAGQVAGVVGEAGVGKSRLLLEMRNRISGDGITYLEGRCLQYGGSIIYLPVLDILRSYFEIKEGDREFLIKKKMREKIGRLDEALLVGTLSPLEEVLSLKVEDEAFLGLEPREKRERIFEAIRDILIRESYERPLVVAVEDLHWVDKSSEDLLNYLMGWLANARILLILLYRPEYGHPWGSRSFYNRVWLDQLTGESSARLVQGILVGGEVAPELRELILERAAGNPLFMEEFTHTLLENGSILKKDQQYILSRSVSEIQVPDTIQAIISARMDRLGENVKQTMQEASVIGKDFAFSILQAVSGMQEVLKPCLMELQRMELIYEKNLFPELEYGFKHALTREVAYASLLKNRKRDIHEKIGEAIERIYGQSLVEFYEVLAYHYSKGWDQSKAFTYLKLSGQKALKNYSNWEAFHLLSQALDVLKGQPANDENHKRQIEVARIMDVPMRILGYPEGSLQILQGGERASRILGDVKSHSTFSSMLSVLYSFKGDSRAVGYAERCFQEAQKAQDLDLLAPTVLELCISYAQAGEYRKMTGAALLALDLLEKAKRESDLFGRPFNPYSAIMSYHGNGMAMLGDFNRGLAFCERSLRFAIDLNHFPAMAWAEVQYAWSLVIRGEGMKALEHLENARRHCEDGQVVLLLGSVLQCLGYAYCILDQLETARGYLVSGLDFSRKAGMVGFLSRPYCFLGMIDLEFGDLEGAENHLEEALSLALKNHEKQYEGLARMNLGRVLGLRDRSCCERAEQPILQGVEVCDKLGLKPFKSLGCLFLGELYGNAGRKKMALDKLNESRSMFQEMGMSYWLDKAQEIEVRL